MIKKIVNTLMLVGAVSLSASTFTYNLSAGWNTISVPVDMGDNALSSFNAQLDESKLIKVWGKNSSSQWDSYTPGGAAFLNKLDTFIPGNVYYFNLSSDSNFSISGSSYSSKTLSFKNGWNTIGVFDSNVTVTELVDKIGESNVIKIWGKNSSNQWDSYTPGGAAFLNKLDTLVPTSVYYINLENISGTMTLDFSSGIENVTPPTGDNTPPQTPSVN